MTDPRIQIAWAAAFEREFARQYDTRLKSRQDAATRHVTYYEEAVDLAACRIAGDRAAAACTEALEKAPR